MCIFYVEDICVGSEGIDFFVRVCYGSYGNVIEFVSLNRNGDYG